MSLFDRAFDGLKNQMLLSDQVKRTAANVDAIRDDVLDHEKRLIRLETLVEITRGDIRPRRLPSE